VRPSGARLFFEQFQEKRASVFLPELRKKQMLETHGLG